METKAESIKHAVAIVTPVYLELEKLPENEKLALAQMKEVLASRDIFLIHPGYINIQKYKDFFLPLQVNSLIIDDQYFGNAKRGNALCIMPALYEPFTKYDYILIHHSDAYVFSDQLDYWCNQGYDYIGAPWFKKSYIRSPEKFSETDYLFLGVGNGGLSLRKVSSFLKVTNDKRFMRYYSRLNLMYHYVDGRKYKYFRYMPGVKLFLKFIERFTMHEDKFWGLTVPKYLSWFKVASPEHAIKFAFEALPWKLYEMNNLELPFGCHAWEKFGKEFWLGHIPARVNEPV